MVFERWRNGRFLLFFWAGITAECYTYVNRRYRLWLKNRSTFFTKSTSAVLHEGLLGEVNALSRILRLELHTHRSHALPHAPTALFIRQLGSLDGNVAVFYSFRVGGIAFLPAWEVC